MTCAASTDGPCLGYGPVIVRYNPEVDAAPVMRMPSVFTVCVLGIGDGMLPSSGLFASVDGGAIVLVLVNSGSCDRAG